jgi:hypothetical protein
MIHLTSPPHVRLAVLLLATLSFSGCNSDPSTQDAHAGASVDDAPRSVPSVTVASGAPVHFVIDDADTDSVTWSALSAADADGEGASIDAVGMFRATRAGRYLVMAARGGAHALAYVTVTEDASTGAAAAPVTLSFEGSRTASRDKRLNLSLSEFWIEVTPDSVSLAPGEKRQLTVVGRSADGTRWTIWPEWEATGGSISSTGEYTAPTTISNHRVIVTRHGDIQTDTSIVTVGVGLVDTAAASPPLVPTAPAPASPTTTACLNEPPGYRRVIDTPWNTLPTKQPGTSDEGFTYFHDQIPTLSIVQDAAAPVSGSSVLEYRYPQGFVGGYAPSKFATRGLWPNEGNLYVCFWIRVSPNWTTLGAAGVKFFYAVQEGSGLAHALLARGENNHLYVNSLLQYRDDRLNYNLGESGAPADDISGGGWHKVEVLWEANTPGQRNGAYRQWVDGELTGTSQEALWFLAGNTPRWDVLWFESTYGSPNEVIPSDQSWYLDQMVVSVK